MRRKKSFSTPTSPYESPEDPGCYDDDGNLICGKIQVLEHQHTDACFETVEEPADTEALTCTLPEDEKHTHTALCYGTWELTCDMEEHTHTAECSTAEETEATEETEETEETTEPEEEMSGMEIDPSLPVMGTAYVSGAKTRAYSVMTLDADTTGATDPVSVKNYITGATLYYRTNENGEWTDVSGVTDIPGNADFKLVISYGNVPIDDLPGCGRENDLYPAGPAAQRHGQRQHHQRQHDRGHHHGGKQYGHPCL